MCPQEERDFQREPPNLTIADRQRWIGLAGYYGYAWTVVEIESLDEEEHKKRCAEHDFLWSVIEDQRRRYQPVENKARDKYTLVKQEDL